MTAPDPSTLSVLVVDDEPGIRQSLRLCLEADGARVLGVASAEAAFEVLDRAHFDVVFLDVWLGSKSGIDAIPEILRHRPGVAIIVITAFASFESAVEAMKRGAIDYLPKPFTPEQVRAAARRVVEASALRSELREARTQLRDVGGDDATFETESPRFRTFLDVAERAAAADCVTLILGESGTGKNVLARFIRANSPRASGPFVSVNCPSLSSDLMSSSLFGHRRGAFTGATHDVPGLVQEAEGGTLFLDEIGDLAPDAQSRLLRFLNDRSYQRLGESVERRADVRIIAATNRSLEAEVRAGRFREDLLFRLNVVSLEIPPLRERREDVLALAEHYLTRFSRRLGRGARTFSDNARAALLAHGWPGNLRELRNAVERAVILGVAPAIEPADLGLQNVGARGIELGADVSLDEIEREHIARVVSRSPTLDAAARILGIDPTTLMRKRKRYGLG